MKIIPIIVTYNRLNKLKQSLKAWFNEGFYKLIIVDNNSTDGTTEFLKSLSQKDKRVIHIKLPYNMGGAGGFYEGLNYAMKNIPEADWFVLQDDDAYPQSGTIKKFKESTPNPENCYTPAIYLPNGEISLMNIPGYFPNNNLKRILKGFFLGSKGLHLKPENFQEKKIIEVDFASFVGFFISPKVVKKVGLPKKEFFIYSDDVEYCLRLKKAGVKILFNPELIFIHDTETLYQNKKIYKPIWKAYYVYRNGIFLYKEIFGPLFPFALSYRIVEWIKNGFYYDDKKNYYKTLFKAIKDGLSNNFSPKFPIEKDEKRF